MNLSHSQARRLDPATLRLPLIALIDVVLFLLFYFIIAGTIAAEETELSSTLSIAKGQGGASFLDAQLLRINWQEDHPVYQIGALAIRDRDQLLTFLRDLPKEPGIVIRADDMIEIQTIASVLRVVKDAGFTKITYVPLR